MWHNEAYTKYWRVKSLVECIVHKTSVKYDGQRKEPG